MSLQPQVFLAYPGYPALLAETMTSAAKKLESRYNVIAKPWQSLVVDGRVVISQITEAIDGSAVVLAEIGSLNPNVLFEVGYALAAEKQLLLLLDSTDTSCMKNWNDLGVLSSVGYTSYSADSAEIVRRFGDVYPATDAHNLWEDLLVSGNAGPRESRTVFYLPLGLRGDAGKILDRTLLARRNLSVNTADQEEQGLAPLSWYVSKLYSSSAAILHLRAPNRVRAVMHNARASLFAGIAVGLKLPTLILAEEGFTAPFDYQEVLYTYATAKRLADHTNGWLDDLPSLQGTRAVGRTKLTAELPRFGEYVAENEQDELPDYFVETGQYEAVLEGRSAIFVGRKGTGKTANMLTAAEALVSDKRNLVTVVKPSGFELESLVAVLAKLQRRELADFFLDALWRFILLTEVASTAVREAEARPAGIATGSEMESLRAHLEEFAGGTELNFTLRLERVTDSLLEDLSKVPDRIEDAQAWFTERLHGKALVELRAIMGRALRDKKRVAVLVDNLDKAWERNADKELQSRLILGLLSAIGRLEKDFRRDEAWRERVNVTLAVFLRADIFDVVRQHAREPDKITTLQVKWDDPTLLARVIEDRYTAQRGEGTPPEELWNAYFCPLVGDRVTKEYLLWRSLPRPRDLVYLCNACVLTAANHRHTQIEEADILQAEQDYSRFALDALRVEGSPSEEIDDILLYFAGSSPMMPLSEAMTLLNEATVTMSSETALSLLVRANFLGIEVTPGIFEYPVTDQGEKKAWVLSRRLAGALDREARLIVHPAFRPYLSIKDS